MGLQSNIKSRIIFLLILKIFLVVPDAFAANMIRVGGDSFTCTETHKKRYESRELGRSTISYQFCKAGPNKMAFYEPGSDRIVLISPQGAELKSLENKDLSGVFDHNQVMAMHLQNYLEVAGPGNDVLKVVNAEEFRLASGIAFTHLRKMREKSLSEKKLPEKIRLEGIIPDKSLECKRGATFHPRNKKDMQWASFSHCSVYHCRSGSQSFAAFFDGDSNTVSVNSLNGAKLGATYLPKKVTDLQGKVLADNSAKPPSLFYTSPQMAAAFGDNFANRMNRKYRYAECEGNPLKDFSTKYEKAIKEKKAELANLEVAMVLKESFGVIQNVIEPSFFCAAPTVASFAAPPGAQIPTDKKTMTESEANNLFKVYKNRPDLPQYTPAGCEARAHVIAQDLDDKGYFTEKIFLLADGLSPELDPSIQWRMHVAPLVSVKKSDGTIERMVIDTALFDAPVSMETWLNSVKRTEGQKLMWSSYPPPVNYRDYHRAIATITPWTVYSDKHKEAKTAQEKQAFLEEAIQTNRGNQEALKRIQESYSKTEFFK